MTTKAITKSEAIFRGVTVTHRPDASVKAVNSIASHASRQVPLFIPADQVYYWSSQWQKDEAASLADLKAGRAKTFGDPQDAIRHLLSDD